MKPYEAQNWIGVCTWFFPYVSGAFFRSSNFARPSGLEMDWIREQANTALIFWRHEGPFVQRGAGGRIVYSFSFISTQCGGFEHFEHQATAHLKATHWIFDLVDVHGNNCQAGTQMIFHSALFFRCRLSASLRSTSSEGFFNSSSFLLMANICISRYG